MRSQIVDTEPAQLTSEKARLAADATHKLTETEVGQIETAKRMFEEIVAEQGSKVNHDTFPFDSPYDRPASYRNGYCKSLTWCSKCETGVLLTHSTYR